MVPDIQNLTAEDVLEVLLEAERCAIRTWTEICDMTQGLEEHLVEVGAE